MGKERCRPILTGKTICSTPELFNEGNLGKGPFQGGFQPSDLDNGIVNLQTFNASQFTLDGSNNGSNWIDLFGNGNDFGQTTALDRPDGSNVLTDGFLFDGGNEFLESDANIANFTSFETFTYFSVIKRTTATEQMVGLGFADSSQSDNLIKIDNVLNSDFGTAAARNDLGTQFQKDAVNDFVFGDTPTVNDVYALAAITSNGSRWVLRLNGAILGKTVLVGSDSGEYADTLATADTISLGALMDSTPQFFEGGLRAVTMYSGEKSNEDIGLVETFLNDKYTIF